MDVAPFPNNWSYLRAELNWLDRVLSQAIARQRQDAKEIDRFARTRADRVTNHWWKGLVSLEGVAAYDAPVPQAAATKGANKGSYQQQMEAKIRASQAHGINLGIPLLRDRFQLSNFEKNLIVLALAPEINRRYGRIYNYLQETEYLGAAGLPNVDLLLRLLCRNDGEWRAARQALTAEAILRRCGLIELSSLHAETLLTRLVKLSDAAVDYLLAEHPDGAHLEALVRPLPGGALAPAGLHPLNPHQAVLEPHTLTEVPLVAESSTAPPADPWANLVVPEPTLNAVQHLCYRTKTVVQLKPTGQLQAVAGVGTMAAFVGRAGSGKKTAAQAIAHTLQEPLYYANLALLSPIEQAQLQQTLMQHDPPLLLLESAQVWLGRSSSLSEYEVNQLLQRRQHMYGMTLFAVDYLQMLRPAWRRQIPTVIDFPWPDRALRLRLWQHAFPPQTCLDPAIDWEALARPKLTGGQIAAIAQEAVLYAASESAPQVSLIHLQRALTSVTVHPVQRSG